MSEIFTAPTTTPSDTFVEAPHNLTDGVLLYRPDENCFIALYPDEWLLCRAEGHQNMTAIEELQEANREVTEKSLLLQHLLQQPNSAKADIARAKKDLDVALDNLSKKSDAAKQRVEAITSQKTDHNKLVELLPLTTRRMERARTTPIYINAQRLNGALADRRVYLVEGSAERKKHPKEKLFNGHSLNTDQVRKRISDQVQDKAKFEKKWKLAPKDADQFSVIFTDWAKVMGTSVTACLERTQTEIIDGIVGADKRDPNNPYRMIDLKPEAQFLRWSAGAGAEATFMPFQGSLYDARDRSWGQRFKRAAKSAQFGIKANAESSFAVGEAKVETILYLPHAAGWHLDPTLVGAPFDFGYFRFRGDLTLYALAGASIALEAGATLMITGDKQGLRGTPPNQRGAKAKVGAKGEAKVFAGLKEGIDLAGALQWLNPEGFVDPKTPKKADASKAIAAYTDVASVSAGASLIQGLAATLGFECDYRDGNFVVAAKAGACLGLGGSGSVAGKVGAAQISQFFMCIAHQLKQADYKKMVGLIPKEAFATFSQILYLVVAGHQTLESFIGSEAIAIEQEVAKISRFMRQTGEQFIKKVEQELRSGWGWYAYMPPESRGALVRTVVDACNQPRNTENNDLRQVAAFVINEMIATTQSIGHLENTLDRITVAMGEEPGRNRGVQMINSVVAGTMFGNCIDRCEMQLAKAEPLMGRPFLRNDERDFHIAQFPLHHPGYPIA
ncbi:MAG: hypothetical protein JWR65_2435 [Massilia sp.]|jgi:hypothetical protein|nr:hypothetical protein [Massilia sp.]